MYLFVHKSPFEPGRYCAIPLTLVRLTASARGGPRARSDIQQHKDKSRVGPPLLQTSYTKRAVLRHYRSDEPGNERVDDVWAGAAATAVLFTIGKFAIGMYIGKAGIGTGYGAAGSIVILITWTYYSVQILFFGAELTQVSARRHGTRVIPEKTPYLWKQIGRPVAQPDFAPSN